MHIDVRDVPCDGGVVPCTWCQRVPHAERQRRSDEVDNAARVQAHVLHGGRQVTDLRLQLVQQRRMHVEQRVGLRQMRLQCPKTLVEGGV